MLDRCVTDRIAVGPLRPDERIIARNQIDIPYAYVVYDHVRKWLEQQDILLACRYSEWEYYNSDHAFIAGRKAADAAVAAPLDSAAELVERA